MKIISGHQAVYLPWLGLFHKLYLCDTFVYMDTVQYLHNDFNNRNKIRIPDGWIWLSVPVDQKNSRSKMLNDIIIKDQNPESKDYWQAKHWKSIEVNYCKSKYFEDYAGSLEKMYTETKWEKLVDLCWAQFNFFAGALGIKREIIRMSEVPFKGVKDELVLDHCMKLNGDAVVFGALGRDYVREELFTENRKKIYFQQYIHPQYQQRFKGFEPYMTIADLLFNHGPDSMDILLSGNITQSQLRSELL
ncbi:WbqC family protein [Deferribacteres bacterium DY0037]